MTRTGQEAASLSVSPRRRNSTRSLLLLGDTEGLSASTSGLGSLTSDSDAPEVSETSMVLALSKSLKILSHHSIKLIGDQLRPVSVSWVLLSVEEPFWDVVFDRSGKNIADSVDFFLGDFTGSLVTVDLSDLKG